MASSQCYKTAKNEMLCKGVMQVIIILYIFYINI